MFAGALTFDFSLKAERYLPVGIKCLQVRVLDQKNAALHKESEDLTVFMLMTAVFGLIKCLSPFYDSMIKKKTKLRGL
jgi:hypothetical protein